MASNTLKRSRPNIQLKTDSDSSEERILNQFAKFIVLTAKDDFEPLLKMSPFVIEKSLKGHICRFQITHFLIVLSIVSIKTKLVSIIFVFII